jgi:hypothetical protein
VWWGGRVNVAASHSTSEKKRLGTPRRLWNFLTSPWPLKPWRAHTKPSGRKECVRALTKRLQRHFARSCAGQRYGPLHRPGVSRPQPRRRVGRHGAVPKPVAATAPAARRRPPHRTLAVLVTAAVTACGADGVDRGEAATRRPSSDVNASRRAKGRYSLTAGVQARPWRWQPHQAFRRKKRCGSECAHQHQLQRLRRSARVRTVSTTAAAAAAIGAERGTDFPSRRGTLVPAAAAAAAKRRT